MHAYTLNMCCHAIMHSTRQFPAAPLPRIIPKPAVLSLMLSLLPDMLSLLELSRLLLMLLLLDLRRACRAWSGSCGCNPLAFANRFKMSVKLITPFNLPDRLAPGIADAEIAGATVLVWSGGVVVVMGMLGNVEGRGVIGDGGTRIAGVTAGVGGPEEAGEAVSTTHMRCELVATSLATVWARVE